MLDDGKSQQSQMLQNAIESFALDRIGPAGDVISLMKAAPSIIRAAKILQLKRKKKEAYLSGKFDKGDRYDALLNCWQFGDCNKARRIQAEIRKKAGVQNVPSAPIPSRPSIPAYTPPPAPACPGGQKYCSPGSYGPGGCYSVRAQNCSSGLICRSNYYACKLAGDPAHCQLGYTPCQSIKPHCTPPLKWCPPGPNGKGRCMRQGEVCNRGLVCRKGSCICKLPNIPAYCAPCGAVCKPRPKPAPKALSPCPAGLKYCPPGAFGRGGCIRPYQSCIRGLVCPTGYFYCKLPGEAAYCTRPGSRCVSRRKPVQTPLIPPPPRRSLVPSRCRPPRVWCPAGAYGGGGCYLPGVTRCIRGKTCPGGFKVCKVPGERARCIPAMGMCLAKKRPRKPVNSSPGNFVHKAPKQPKSRPHVMKKCPPNGRGVMYFADREYCKNGKLYSYR